MPGGSAASFPRQGVEQGRIGLTEVSHVRREWQAIGAKHWQAETGVAAIAPDRLLFAGAAPERGIAGQGSGLQSLSDLPMSASARS